MKARTAILVVGGAALSAAAVAACYAYYKGWLAADEAWRDGDGMPASDCTSTPAGRPGGCVGKAGTGSQDASCGACSAQDTYALEPIQGQASPPGQPAFRADRPAEQSDGAITCHSHPSAAPGGAAEATPAAQQQPTSEHDREQHPDISQPATATTAEQPQPAHDDITSLNEQQAAYRLRSAASESLASSSSGPLARSLSGTPVRRPMNTTVHHPPLDTANSSSALAASLQLHYPQPEGSAKSLAFQCSLLCERHCPQLQDFTGELGDTIALDLACGAGGTSFELAQSFSHVLGIDGDPMLVLAAKELKEHGQLDYQATDSSGSMVSCTARVPEGIDRDRVRFWHYDLPALPPKLKPLDAVLVADVQQRLPQMLQVLEAMPSLLKPQGVCVVVLPAAPAQPNALQHADVVACLESKGLTLVTQEQFRYAAIAGMPQEVALATVWRQK